MHIRQYRSDGLPFSESDLLPLQEIAPDLLLVFASVDLMADPTFLATLRRLFPGAQPIGCSSAGEISSDGVGERGVVLNAVSFQGTRFQIVEAPIESSQDSFNAGANIGRQLSDFQPQAICLFGPGVNVNGSAIISGINSILDGGIPIAGGLAGDNGRFEKTLVLSPGGISPQTAVAIGLAGERLAFSHGSFGGWSPFGPVRKVTRCEGGILFELDGKPALDVYRHYLGDYARDLPAAGLLFPFEMLDANHDKVGLIRTILGIDEDQGSLTLAGEIEPDGHLRLMHANIDNLVDGAEEAARQTVARLARSEPGLAILISCVGRKLVMGDHVDEEVEVVADILGPGSVLTGFYSYGEFSPLGEMMTCKLHNQTMTIAYIGES